MSDRLCGCHVVTAASVTTSLQLILLVLTLASTGIVLNRYRTWETYEPREVAHSTALYSEATEKEKSTQEGKTIKTLPSRWSKSFLELAMAWYVGFASFWLFSIIILILSFKYYRPVFVIPNFTALLLGCFMNLIGFGSMLGRILDSSKDYQTNDYEESILCYIMGLMLIAFFICLAFIIFIYRYHKFLKLRYGHQVPKFVQPKTRTGYPDEMY